MVYLGGVAFGRTSNEVEITYLELEFCPDHHPNPAERFTRSTTYDVRPDGRRRRTDSHGRARSISCPACDSTAPRAAG